MNPLDLLTDHTVRTVALGAALLGVVCGLLGPFALLRRQSLLGDTLAHAALPGVCLGFLIAGGRQMEWILGGALVTGALAALCVLGLVRGTKLKTDAALGIVLSLFFAAGVVLLTHVQTSGASGQSGLEGFLFGQAAATLTRDLYVLAGLAAAALGLVLTFWKEFKLVSFDPDFAGSLGLPVRLIEALLTAIVALAVVAGLQLVGVVLMAAMVVAPAAAARQWSGRLSIMIAVSVGMGVVAGVTGAGLSAVRTQLATGPLIVLSACALVLVSLAVAPERGLVWERRRQRARARRLEPADLLGTLRRLAAEHDDPHYPAEKTMLDAYHGTNTGPTLAELARDGLVARTTHMPNEAGHWTLTRQGQSEAGA